MALRLWVYLRLGLPTGIVLNLPFDALLAATLTTDFSAWFAGNGLAVAAFFLALVARAQELERRVPLRRAKLRQSPGAETEFGVPSWVKAPAPRPCPQRASRWL